MDHQTRMFLRRTVVTVINDDMRHCREKIEEYKGHVIRDLYTDRLSTLEWVARNLKVRRLGDVKKLKVR